MFKTDKSEFWCKWLGKFKSVLPENLREPTSKKFWRRLFDDERRERRSKHLLAFQFIALAYRASRSKENCDIRNMRDLAKELGDFEYSIFSTNREKLEQQLLDCGIRIFRSDSGKYQYLRTLQLYSGHMYVKCAKALADVIGESSWEALRNNRQKIEDALKDSIKHYSSGKGMEGKNTTKENFDTGDDVVSLFLNLVSTYCDNNAYVTKEDVLAIAPTFTQEVAAKIADLMPKRETFPKIVLKDNGQVVINFPRKGVFPGAVGEYVIFYLEHRKTRDDGDEPHFIRYFKESNGWQLEGGSGNGRSFHVETFKSIRRNNVEKLPVECQRSDYLLVYKTGKTTTVLQPCQKLIRDQKYRLQSLNGEHHEVKYNNGEKKSSLKVEEGWLCVPYDAEEIIIDDNIYPVKKETDQWFQTDQQFRNVRGTPWRRFFERSKYPFSKESVANGNITVFYRDDKGNEIELSLDDKKWYVPESCMWGKKALLLSRPMIPK